MSEQPWFKRALRWGQTNLTEIDPRVYDIELWRSYWRETRTQGVIVNAGGIVAYYPSRHPLHRRAEHLGDRDLFGEIVAAAREEGLCVLARMDSNRARQELYDAHPDWFCVDRAGRAYRAGDFYLSCINSRYYDEYLPAILEEIIDRYRPDGFADNSWCGLSRDRICCCDNCRRTFRDELPGASDWSDPVYRRWIEWSYARRLELWDANNRITRARGGPTCLWLGMLGGDLRGECASFRDDRAIAKRAQILLLDHQSRHDRAGFAANSEAGKRLKGVLGWNKLIPESMAMYQSGGPAFRRASKPAAEARMWMLEGIAGGLSPWWHFVGAHQEDRRQFRTPVPVYAWHEANRELLFDREPVASVGIVWSQRSIDFHGRDSAEEISVLPYRGVVHALVRARIPYVPIAIDDVADAPAQLRTLVLPNVGALSDPQCEALRAFALRGGGLVATGETSLYDHWGDRREDFALGDLLGARHRRGSHGSASPAHAGWDAWERHSYLRLQSPRHEILDGFDETEIVPFGGRLEITEPAAEAQALLTFIPPFPIYPPETAWMRQERTDVPACTIHRAPSGARIVYLAADLDRCLARDNLPDHARLLANVVRWSAAEPLPLEVRGPGLLDCQIYRQPGRLIVHVVNLTSAESWRLPAHETVPVGPLEICAVLPEDVTGRRIVERVTGLTLEGTVCGGSARFVLPSVAEHGFVVIE